MSSFENLRIVDNFYQTSLYFPMPTVVISGGNHAYFGMYGEQEGDGEATIENTEQIIITADAISEFIFEN